MSEEIRDAAEKAAKLFREYYHIHMAKTPPDVEKARRNGDMCSLIEAALAAPVSPTREDVARAIAIADLPVYLDDAIWAEDLEALKRRAERGVLGNCFRLADAVLNLFHQEKE